MMTIIQRSPKEQRERIRNGFDTVPTTGMCAGYTQANLVILPKEYAFDFLLFANRNPKPCPIVDVMEPGQIVSNIADPTSNICTDIGKYRIYKKGELIEEVEDITPYWRDDFVSFLIGCSYTFENALENAGIEMLFRTAGNNVAMYKTNIPCYQAGIFHGPLVVSMRPVPKRKLVTAVEVTAKFIHTHGAPIHIGDPSKIGIEDITKPSYGDFTPYDEEEYVPVFWACGVTPQEVAKASKPEIMITHTPGYMFISDRKESL
ncbi:putative hydro-lyase [Sporolactobacillus sp. THM7-4]|nr:putative hydro-lyase [Sporolactobacillus sp. THM7-4]